MKAIKKITLGDFIGLIKFIIVLIPAFVRKHILKKQRWLISEHLTARDNGYVFFKYMREKHPEIPCYYAIDYKHNDYEKLKDIGNTIKWGSIKHYYYYMSARWNISAHKNGSPNHLLFTFLRLHFNLYNNFVFIQHGVIYQNFEMFHKKNSKFKLFITGAKPEYEFVKEKYGYDDEVKYTGLARFDELHDAKVDDKLILYMPTWRRYLDSKEKLEQSLYYKKIISFINNKELNKILQDEDKYLWFCPHGGLKQLCNDFSSSNDRIKIIDINSADVHELLMKGAILITDFSSVHTDFAYMKKPIIYYQYDEKDYFEKHIGANWKDTYYDFKRDGFGDVVNCEEDIIRKIREYINSKYVIEKEYSNRVEHFFPLYDKRNSERIFDEIIKAK